MQNLIRKKCCCARLVMQCFFSFSLRLTFFILFFVSCIPGGDRLHTCQYCCSKRHFWPKKPRFSSKKAEKVIFFRFFRKKRAKCLHGKKKVYTFASLLKRNTTRKHWKGGRVVDYSGLENRRAERHRGFESLPFRREASSESCSLFFVHIWLVVCVVWKSL